MTRATAGPAACTGEHCITCGDEGVPMRVLAVDPETGLGRCAGPEAVEHEVELSLVDAQAGDLVLVHADTALVRLEEAA